MDIPALLERNIILIGFMGVGKTEVGGLLSKRLYRDFIDVDQEIENKFQMPISQIFAEQGEQAFRRIERQVTIDYITNTRLKIISLGGGAYVQKAIREAALSHGVVIHLDLTWDEWKKRIDQLVETRPKLQDRDLDEIKQLYDERRYAYATNNFKVKTDGLSVEEVVSEIEKSLKIGWELYHPQTDIP